MFFVYNIFNINIILRITSIKRCILFCPLSPFFIPFPLAAYIRTDIPILYNFFKNVYLLPYLLVHIFITFLFRSALLAIMHKFKGSFLWKTRKSSQKQIFNLEITISVLWFKTLKQTLQRIPKNFTDFMFCSTTSRKKESKVQFYLLCLNTAGFMKAVLINLG